MSIYNFEFIREKAQTHGRDLAFVDEAHEVTFREFEFYTCKIATYLRDRGIKKGDLVTTILPSYLDWHFTFALFRLGIATMSKNNYGPFNPEAQPDWCISLQPHKGISPEKAIIINESVMATINSASEEIELTGYSGPDDLVRLTSTSGTSGQLKYVSLTARDLENKVKSRSSYDLAGLDPAFSMYPFAAGQSYGLALKNILANKTYYSCGFTDYRLAKVLTKYPIRTLTGSPVQVSALLDVLEQTGTSLPLLKTIIMGGSPPSLQLIKRIKSHLDCQIFNAYGSTEANNIALEEITQHEEGLKFAGTIMHDDVTIEIVDENDQPLPQGAIGVIRYTRPFMSKSYYKNPVATAQFFKDGYFYPGDKGYLDPAGKLVLEGRINEVINLGGVKLNPEIIDEIALAQLGVIDCATFAVPGPTGIDQLAMALVTDGDFTPELFEKAMAKKSPYAISKMILTDKIARNENGKILRSALTQRFIEESSR
jgi:acyl-coenzyme A synthetase/AMP-(fatty) acid ligase